MMYALCLSPFFFFFFNDTATTEIYTLSLHDALPISATWSSSWPSASAFAVSASVHAPARRTKILRSSTARTPSCLVCPSQLRRPSCTARASDSRPAAARAIACWFAISALPRSAGASRTSSSALGCSLWASSPSRRSRYSPASSAKKSDMPSGLLGSVMELQHKPSAFGRQRRRLVHELSHAPHRLFHPPEHRVTHDRVPDVQLFDLGDRGDRLYVLVGEPVTRVHGEAARLGVRGGTRSEEHTSELQSQSNLVCRLLLEKKKKTIRYTLHIIHTIC